MGWTLRDALTFVRFLGEDKMFGSRRALFATLVVVGAAGCPKPAPQSPRATDADADRVQDTVLGVIGVYNNEKAISISLDERSAQLAKFYVPDNAFGKDDAPIYFDPPSKPSKAVVVGTADHLRNMSVAYDSYAKSGLSYNLQLSETQVRIDGSIAVVIARTLGTIRTPKGEVVDTAPGRWTVVLERVGDRWLISHEHISFYAEPQG